VIPTQKNFNYMLSRFDSVGVTDRRTDGWTDSFQQHIRGTPECSVEIPTVRSDRAMEEE